MTQLLAFAFYLCMSCVLLVAAPVMMVPGLSMKRKLLICDLYLLDFYSFFLGALHLARRPHDGQPALGFC